MPIRINPSSVMLLSILLGGCASHPGRISQLPTQSRDPVSSSRQAVVRYALALKGTPYRWGKESPTEGFDCSGFVQHVFSRHGTRLPRTARQMANHLHPIDQHTRQPGDLVFFNTTGEPFSHVGIYVGNGAFVHSSSVRGQVIVSALNGHYWLEHFLGFRRPAFGHSLPCNAEPRQTAIPCP
ncbi:NlpC/P60 family protein [Candidatus Woesearchaeota archaeon]|nr:NlpC/P60 family protein [Candidatus Woesearchaeota archaeon]